ncbi:hypothetical protein FHETE_6963 [Fusarium heterosporum]|uniref:Uncharacterized protein n=1 Tax=Fusarium heterosporum TaxID=42747 RepID=A0A8H5T7S4_FUSHE|nr:hypothetical protein FHETE_6963 [Fusarium heterosporum]
MSVNLTKDIGDILEKGSHHYLENAQVLAYGLNDATMEAVQQVCDRATESYAREILNRRFGTPDIFKVDTCDGKLKDLYDCIDHFIDCIRILFETSPPYDLPIYPHAFIIIDTEKVQSSETVTLVVAYEENEEWKLGHCSVPVKAELGLTVESLRMGDITEEDALGQFSDPQK